MSFWTLVWIQCSREQKRCLSEDTKLLKVLPALLWIEAQILPEEDSCRMNVLNSTHSGHWLGFLYLAIR